MLKHVSEVIACPVCADDGQLHASVEGLECGRCLASYAIVKGRPILTAWSDADANEELREACRRLPNRADVHPDPMPPGMPSDRFFHEVLFSKLNRRDPPWGFLGRMVADMTSRVSAGSAVLDIGAGEAKYGRLLGQAKYVAFDLVTTSDRHDFSGIDVVGEAGQLPFCSNQFDVCLNLVVLEHVPDAPAVVREMCRVLRSGGEAYSLVPLVRPVHLAPFDFNRFTEYGVRSLFERAGLEIIDLRPSNGALWTSIHYGRQFALDQVWDRMGRKSKLAIALNRLLWLLTMPLVIYGRRSDRHYPASFPIYYWVRARKQ